MGLGHQESRIVCWIRSVNGSSVKSSVEEITWSETFDSKFTALWKHDFGFNEFRLHHFFRILECFNMRYISDISYARIMKYGNPDIYFLRFFWIFLDFPDIWVKVHNNIMFLNSYPISCRKYYSMTIKVAVNPEKILKIFFVSKFSSKLT